MYLDKQDMEDGSQQTTRGSGRVYHTNTHPCGWLQRNARCGSLCSPGPLSGGKPATASSKSSPSGTLPTPPRASPLSTTSHTCQEKRKRDR